MPLRDLLVHLTRGPRRSHAHDHHAHRHAHYGEDELLARADEFNRNAERHWREIAAEPEGRKHPLKSRSARSRTRRASCTGSAWCWTPWSLASATPSSISARGGCGRSSVGPSDG